MVDILEAFGFWQQRPLNILKCLGITRSIGARADARWAIFASLLKDFGALGQDGPQAVRRQLFELWENLRFWKDVVARAIRVECAFINLTFLIFRGLLSRTAHFFSRPCPLSGVLGQREVRIDQSRSFLPQNPAIHNDIGTNCFHYFTQFQIWQASISIENFWWHFKN